MKSEPITVATANNIIEAEILKSQIELQGISVFLADANIVGIFGELSNAIGGIRLVVSSEDAEDALNIVRKTRAEISANNEDENEDTGWGECPKCRSKNIKHYRGMFGWKGILAFFGFSTGKTQRVLVCNKCRNEWTDV